MVTTSMQGWVDGGRRGRLIAPLQLHMQLESSRVTTMHVPDQAAFLHSLPAQPSTANHGSRLPEARVVELDMLGRPTVKPLQSRVIPFRSGTKPPFVTCGPTG